MNPDAHQIAAEIIAQLEQAWNKADGPAFAAPFTEDANFVDIRGDYHRTQEAIARGHQHVFDTIYKDSVVRSEVIQARLVAEQVIIAHIKNTLSAPTGPLAGEHSSVSTLVIVATKTGWQIAAFQNTLQTG
jgi:uncharacterized protein (TIGR02246 family)